MLRKFPVLRRRLVELALKRLGEHGTVRPEMADYMSQSLYQGQSLLVLDLTKCTRCDECTRACVAQHGEESHGVPLTRLLREGLRFGDNLIATSCRSCKDAYCMIGCPVDAIHRGRHQQIVIEDHCIGCGLCANNCPFGNIWMAPNLNNKIEMTDPDDPGKSEWIAQAQGRDLRFMRCRGQGEQTKAALRACLSARCGSSHVRRRIAATSGRTAREELNGRARIRGGSASSLGIFWRADVLVRLCALEMAVEARPPSNKFPRSSRTVFVATQSKTFRGADYKIQCA